MSEGDKVFAVGTKVKINGDETVRQIDTVDTNILGKSIYSLNPPPPPQ